MSISRVLVKVDGKEVGLSPLRDPLILGPGEHEITISLEKHDTVTHTLNLTSGAETTAIFELKESKTEITVVANEDSADVSLDGQKIGTTPFDDPIVVAPGPHPCYTDGL